jgi:hypothetical protein
MRRAHPVATDPRARASLAWCALFALLLISAVVSCRREATVATLLDVEGTVARSEGGRPFIQVERGARFKLNDGLQTGPGSSARLLLANGSTVRVGANARLRVDRGSSAGAQGPALDFELGAAEIETATTDLLFLTRSGQARVARGARARVTADETTVTIEVLFGRAVMIEPDGEHLLVAGEGLRIRIGGAVVERLHLTVGNAIVEQITPVAHPGEPQGSRITAGDNALRTAPASQRDDDGQAPGSAQLEGEIAGSVTDRHGADVSVTAGERAIVHDSRAAVAVRLLFNDVCPTEGVVEVRKGRQRERLAGAGAVVLRLGHPQLNYRLRCAGDPDSAAARASGVLSLRRDSGNVPISRRAPANTIDADGRRYTVLFQTRLPALTLVWREAPAAAEDLELHLQSGVVVRTLPGETPQKLASGTLTEGTYWWWFTTNNGRRSPRTTVTIRFDNAAPTAQFFRTAAAEDPHGTILVDGVTLPGAKISAGGNALAVDDHGRFRGDIAPQPGDSAVGVRLEHPRTGVHYYVRRHSSARQP